MQVILDSIPRPGQEEDVLTETNVKKRLFSLLRSVSGFSVICLIHANRRHKAENGVRKIL